MEESEIEQEVMTRDVGQRKRMEYDQLTTTVAGQTQVVKGKVGRKVMRDEMSFQVVEAKDIYNNQSKTMQARSATNARYPAAARDRSRRAEDLRSDGGVGG